MVYNGPQFFVSNPLYKNPIEECKLNSDYDVIDLTSISEDFISRTNYLPCIPLTDYKKKVRGFLVGQDEYGNEVYDDWIDHYKLGFRHMVGSTSERTLICAVLPRKTAHIHGVLSIALADAQHTVDMGELCASLVLDFYMKILSVTNLMPSRMMAFPMGVDNKYNSALRSRFLLLNCLTTAYADLWKEIWSEDYKRDTWSVEDSRLKPFGQLTEQWKWETPLRNYFERRQALVEIDVIAAMALGLSLEDLEMIYTIQFPVLQQNEADTWYDARGQIVFTCSKGLTGVGLDRKGNARQGSLGWEDIRGAAITDSEGKIVGYQGTAPTHVHTIDPAKSELYGGQQQTFYAPYTRCDRIDDYRTAWAHFEKRFGNTNK